MPGLLKPEPNEIHAYHNDGTHEFHGWASSGTLTSQASWQIVKLEYDTGYETAGDNWIEKYPNGSDQPMFEWDEVESYDYYLLGTHGEL